MKKMSIAEAAEYFRISKEAIHNRIRRGSLQSTTEDGVKFVLIDESAPTKKATATTRVTKKIEANYYQFLQEQNTKLQERVSTLETETRTLREQKEQMLIEERIRIEQIYKEKDEQLKSIINAISTQIVQKTKELEMQFAKPEESLDVEIEEENEIKQDNLISLKKYLKQQKLSSKKTEKLKKKISKISKKDHRFIMVDDKCYLDFSRYSYSDIF